MPSCCDALSPYHAPDFILAVVSCEKYRNWLDGASKSAKVGGVTAGVKQAIHQAVIDHGEHDFYTGQKLEWHLLNHAKSKSPGWKGNASRGRYPSADHYNGRNIADFRICSGTVNWAKGSLTHDQFLELCRNVVQHAADTGSQRKRKA